MISLLSQRLPAVQVLRQRNFGLLWTGQLISTLGDNIFRIALAWEVLILTGSVLAMGIIFFVTLIPTLIFALFGGVAADRLPRRLMMLWSDCGRGCLVGLCALLAWLHLLQFWQLAGLSLFFGIADSFFTPAFQAIIPSLIEGDRLQTANALTRLTTLVSRIIGPPLGAVCIVAVGGPSGAFALDAFSFAVSVLCLAALQLPVPPSSTSAETAPAKAHPLATIWNDARDGLVFVVSKRWLWTTIIIASFINITCAVPMAIALPKLVSAAYGGGAFLLGILLSSNAVGAVIATVTVTFLSPKRKGLWAYLALFISCAGLTVLGLPFSRGNAVILAALACFGIGYGIGIFEVLWMTLLQENVPGEKLGRVFSVDLLGSFILIPAGLLIIGAWSDRIGPTPVFLASGLISIVLAIAGLCLRDIRQLA